MLHLLLRKSVTPQTTRAHSSLRTLISKSMGYYAELLARVLSLSDDQTYRPVWEIFQRQPEYFLYFKYYCVVMGFLIILSLLYARYYSYIFTSPVRLTSLQKDAHSSADHSTDSDGDTYCWTAAKRKKRKGYSNISANSPPKATVMERSDKDGTFVGVRNTR